MEIVIGFFIAMLVGVTGVGAGSLTVPILTLALGVPVQAAVGAALIFATVTKLIATPVYLGRGKIDGKLLLLLAAGGIPGVLLGTVVLNRMRTPGMESAVLSVVGATIVLLAVLSLWRLYRPQQTADRKERHGVLPWVAFPIGVEVGFSSAGAGALGSLALMHFTTLAPASIVGTDLAFGLLVSGFGGALQIATNNVDTVLLYKLCGGGIAGALTGSLLSAYLPSKPLRATLSSVLVILGGQLFWKGFHVVLP